MSCLKGVSFTAWRRELPDENGWVLWDVEPVFWFEGEEDPREGATVATGQSAQEALGRAVLALEDEAVVAKSLREMEERYATLAAGPSGRCTKPDCKFPDSDHVHSETVGERFAPALPELFETETADA